MEGALDWIGQLVQWLGSFFPRIRIVRSTHAGVKFQRGKKVKVIRPGLCIYWPFVTEADIIPVARQTHNLPPQCAVTKDKIEVTVGGVVVYKIGNVVKALTRNWDFNDTITDVALTAIIPVIMQHEYDELILRIADGTIQQQLTAAVRLKLLRYGVSVTYVGLKEFSKCIVIRNVSSNPNDHAVLFPHHG